MPLLLMPWFTLLLITDACLICLPGASLLATNAGSSRSCPLATLFDTAATLARYYARGVVTCCHKRYAIRRFAAAAVLSPCPPPRCRRLLILEGEAHASARQSAYRAGGRSEAGRRGGASCHERATCPSPRRRFVTSIQRRPVRLPCHFRPPELSPLRRQRRCGEGIDYSRRRERMAHCDMRSYPPTFTEAMSRHSWRQRAPRKSSFRLCYVYFFMSLMLSRFAYCRPRATPARRGSDDTVIRLVWQKSRRGARQRRCGDISAQRDMRADTAIQL